MENSQIEQRIDRLEKQVKISHFVTYGLLAFMMPVFLIGHVSAKNEILNVERIVASEYVLSKDGEEFGKWHVKPEKELTAEEKASVGDVITLTHWPSHVELVIGSGDRVTTLTSDTLMMQIKEKATVFLHSEMGLTLDSEGISRISIGNSDTYTTIGDNGIIINSQFGYSNLAGGSLDIKGKSETGGGRISVKSEGEYWHGIELSASDDYASILTGQLYPEAKNMVNISSDYTSHGSIYVGGYLDSHLELLSDSETSSMTISDSKGVNRAVIGNVDIVTTKTGSKTKKSASSITLFDQENNVIYSLP